MPVMLEKEKASSASNRYFTDELRGVGSKMADTIKDVVDRGNKMHKGEEG